MRDLDEQKLTNFNFAMRHSIKKQQAALHLLEEKLNQQKSGSSRHYSKKSGKMLIKANKLVMRVRNEKAVMESMSQTRYRKESDGSESADSECRRVSKKPNLVIQSTVQNKLTQHGRSKDTEDRSRYDSRYPLPLPHELPAHYTPQQTPAPTPIYYYTSSMPHHVTQVRQPEVHIIQRSSPRPRYDYAEYDDDRSRRYKSYSPPELPRTYRNHPTYQHSRYTPPSDRSPPPPPPAPTRHRERSPLLRRPHHKRYDKEEPVYQKTGEEYSRYEGFSEPSSQSCYKVMVSNLHPGVTIDDVQDLFTAIDDVHSLRMLYPGVAEVVFIHKHSAVAAIERYHNRDLDGQPMQIRFKEGTLADNTVTPPRKQKQRGYGKGNPQRSTNNNEFKGKGKYKFTGDVPPRRPRNSAHSFTVTV